jgi:predicted nucleic acid-binding protein
MAGNVLLDTNVVIALLRGRPSRSAPDLLRFAGCISKKDAQEMRAAIEEGCERIDYDGW